MHYRISPNRLLALSLCLIVSDVLATTSLSFNSPSSLTEVSSIDDSIDFAVVATVDPAGSSFTAPSESATLNDWLASSGSSSVDASFQLLGEAGFGFSSNSPSWDQTNAGSDNNWRWRTLNGAAQGVSPRGNGEQFQLGEIIWFEVQGLDEDQVFELHGYTLFDNAPQRLSLYTGDSTSIQFYETGQASSNLSGNTISLTNGGRFGFGWNDAFTSGSRSGLEGIEFDIVQVPEPSGILMLGLVGLAGLVHRRREHC